MHSSRITAGETQLVEFRADYRQSGRNSKMGLCPGWRQFVQVRSIAFARLILSETMNDRRAAEAVGRNPSTAA
ncbi:MAG: hypothetical protein QOJ51_434 [Acidobacteriaceae bacterium]|jgi:hypothetical protein|nr:hypothetical protein [Acidobacteriaceae bacterium]